MRAHAAVDVGDLFKSTPRLCMVSNQQVVREHARPPGNAFQQAVLAEPVIVAAKSVFLEKCGKWRLHTVALAKQRVVASEAVCPKKQDCEPTGAVALITVEISFHDFKEAEGGMGDRGKVR